MRRRVIRRSLEGFCTCEFLLKSTAARVYLKQAASGGSAGKERIWKADDTAVCWMLDEMKEARGRVLVKLKQDVEKTENLITAVLSAVAGGFVELNWQESTALAAEKVLLWEQK